MAANLMPMLTISFAQMPRDPWELPFILGKNTIQEAAPLSPHLPEDATILGEIDWNRDGRPEIFVLKSAVMDTGKLELQTATQQRCEQGADANGPGTTKTRYQFRNGGHCAYCFYCCGTEHFRLGYSSLTKAIYPEV